MTKSVRRILIGAALTGFVVGTTAAASAAPRPGNDAKTAKSAIEKHCCAGKNTCKGNGGCGATKGKNSCSGKGGCSTKTSCKGKPCTDS
jgi:gas vesicle protein